MTIYGKPLEIVERVDCDNVFVLKIDKKAHFSMKAREEVLIFRRRSMQHLDGNRSADACVDRPINYTHSAFGQ